MENFKYLFWLIPLSSVIALSFAYFLYGKTKKEVFLIDELQVYMDRLENGIASFLKYQYKTTAIFFSAVFVILAILSYAFGYLNNWVPFAFLSGGFFSALAGYLGMKTANMASVRTASAASESLNKSLQIAFRSSAVLGLTVVGLALLDISIWFFVLDTFVDAATQSAKMMILTTTLLTFGIGASVQALLVRTSGGVFAKVADVGTDFAGIIEANLPEDDQRNPGSMADNVGDQVADVAGIGADLYESYSISILAAAVLGAATYFQNPAMQLKAIMLPMFIAGLGVIASIVSIFMVKTERWATQKFLAESFLKGSAISALSIFVLSLPIFYFLKLPCPFFLWGSLGVGLVASLVITKSAEYFTSEEYKPTKLLAENACTGSAPVIISGLGVGMVSTLVPVLTIVFAIGMSFMLAANFDMANFQFGLYGIGLAAVGMLSNLGFTLSTNAFSSIADNAKSCAHMNKLDQTAKKHTDALDTLGNTTAATGKAFAIGSAALTVIALLAAYMEEVKIAVKSIIASSGNFPFPNGAEIAKISAIEKLPVQDLMHYFGASIINPKFLIGLLIGSVLAFFFSGILINTVGKYASKLIDEIRWQFKNEPGILMGTDTPNYDKCIDIAAEGARKGTIWPITIAIATPILVGIAFGIPGSVGLLLGSVISGSVLAISLVNTGAAWDNAKKYIETGHLGGTTSEEHNAILVGDIVGDALKDTAGPSLNIFIKLMAIMAIVMAGVSVKIHYLQEIPPVINEITIKGVAKDDSGKRVGKAMIVLSHNHGIAIDSVETNMLGKYRLKVEDEGSYTLFAHKEGYLDDTFTAEVTGEEKVVLADFVMTYAAGFNIHYVLIDSVDNKPIAGVQVELTDQSTGLTENISTTVDGSFNIKLEYNEKGDNVSYTIKLVKGGYIKQTINLEMELADEYHMSNNILMIKYQVGDDLGKLIGVEPVYFAVGSSAIESGASNELDKIATFMNDNPAIEIEIGSHTDSRGSDNYNFKLSDKRGKSAAEYIKGLITKPERISGKGYGETMILNRCKNGVKCSEEEHAENRRTEFRIIKI